MYWPLVTEVREFPVARQTLNLASQRLTTKDGKSIVVSAVVVYRICDIEKALVESFDLDITVSDVALMSCVGVVTSRTAEELFQEIEGKAQDDLTAKCFEALEPYGAEVIKAGFTDAALCRVLSIAMEGSAPQPIRHGRSSADG